MPAMEWMAIRGWGQCKDLDGLTQVSSMIRLKIGVKETKVNLQFFIDRMEWVCGAVCEIKA